MYVLSKELKLKKAQITEKAKTIWKNLPLFLTLLSKRQKKLEGDFFQI